MVSDLLIAIETSSFAGSLAAARGGTVCATRSIVADRRHTAALLPALHDLLGECGATARDIGVLAYSAGPGSFTGLRIAATIARMLQSAVGCAVVAVPTLEVIATGAAERLAPDAHVAAVLDARRGEVFGALFRRAADGTLATLAPAAVHDPAAWLANLPRPLVIAGEGLRVHAAALSGDGVTHLDESCWTPQAATVARLGDALARAGHVCSPTDIVPHYLRRPECEEVYEQRRAAAKARRET
jgi:tRNA threonylcarbamoyladenosine biosynthesis protein TsaB